jgi:hypothetical protein
MGIKNWVEDDLFYNLGQALTRYWSQWEPIKTQNWFILEKNHSESFASFDFFLSIFLNLIHLFVAYKFKISKCSKQIFCLVNRQFFLSVLTIKSDNLLANILFSVYENWN